MATQLPNEKDLRTSYHAWSYQETKMLTDAINKIIELKRPKVGEKNVFDWVAISTVIKTKTPDQCKTKYFAMRSAHKSKKRKEIEEADTDEESDEDNRAVFVVNTIGRLTLLPKICCKI